MSGHSKWSTIKHKKEKTDSQRGKVFTKIGRELSLAVREGGSDPNNNSKLRDVIAKAKAANMPNDNIDRSIKKASGEGSGAQYVEVIYEGYGPNGVAVIVEALTDNRNRTAPEIRYIFDRAEGALGATGCVAWMFDRKGILVIENDGRIDDEALMMSALEAGAEDVSEQEGVYEIVTVPADFSAVREALEKEGYKFLSADIERIAQNTVSLDEAAFEKIMAMIEKLEDNDDVQNVYHNAVEID